MCFWKSYICSNKLDVKETNFSFTQFNRIRNHFFGRWIEIRRASCSRIVGFDCFCFGKHDSDYREKVRLVIIGRSQKSQGKIIALNNIDCVPSNVQSVHLEVVLYVFEDNEAVIKMINKGRSPTMRHVSRTQRVALDWLFDRITFQIKYIDTKYQLADILTKGNFTRDEWNHLLCLFNIIHFSSTACSDIMAKRSQHDSGEERVTAKSRPMMNFMARAPSHVSSSTSVIPGKGSYGSQDLWSSIAKKEERSGRPDIGIDQLKASDHYYHEQFMESFSSANYSKWDDDRAWSSQEWKTDIETYERLCSIH